MQEKVDKLLKHNRRLNSPKTTLTYDSKLVEIKCYARKDGVIPNKLQRNAMLVLPILAISWSSWTKGNIDTSDVPDEDDSSFQQLKQCKSCQITSHSYGKVPSILEQSLEKR